MTATVPAKRSPVTGQSRGAGGQDQKLQLRVRIAELDRQARASAEAGAIEQAAQAILASLDCERRMAATGPQVLQLIKPRT
jgi:hypothetical protein